MMSSLNANHSTIYILQADEAKYAQKAILEEQESETFAPQLVIDNSNAEFAKLELAKPIESTPKLKKPPSAYQLFVRANYNEFAQRESLKDLTGKEKLTAVSKAVSAGWNELSSEEKQIYVLQANEAKDTHKVLLEEQESLKSVPNLVVVDTGAEFPKLEPVKPVESTPKLKKPPSAYQLFIRNNYNEFSQRKSLIDLTGREKTTAVLNSISVAWNDLPSEEKQAAEANDKNKFLSEEQERVKSVVPQNQIASQHSEPTIVKGKKAAVNTTATKPITNYNQDTATSANKKNATTSTTTEEKIGATAPEIPKVHDNDEINEQRDLAFGYIRFVNEMQKSWPGIQNHKKFLAAVASGWERLSDAEKHAYITQNLDSGKSVPVTAAQPPKPVLKKTTLSSATSSFAAAIAEITENPTQLAKNSESAQSPASVIAGGKTLQTYQVQSVAAVNTQDLSAVVETATSKAGNIAKRVKVRTDTGASVNYDAAVLEDSRAEGGKLRAASVLVPQTGKKPPSAYRLFLQQNWSKFQEQVAHLPTKERFTGTSRALSKAWKNISAEEKNMYDVAALNGKNTNN
ncbi:hypothetical protein HK100_004720, partial [Physocladia obscura]